MPAHPAIKALRSAAKAIREIDPADSGLPMLLSDIGSEGLKEVKDALLHLAEGMEKVARRRKASVTVGHAAFDIDKAWERLDDAVSEMGGA